MVDHAAGVPARRAGGPSSPAPVSVLGRAVRVIEAFRPGESTLGVSEVARRSGLHVATASRLVAELVEHGLLRREADRRVGLGLRLWELGSRASPALTLREAAMPPMEDLHAVVGHHTQLGVRDGHEVLFVERLSTPDAVINYTRIAGRLPLHASSSGLVLLAHAPREVQEAVLASPLQTFTTTTIATPRALRCELDRVRRDGAAVCPGHFHPDACGVAVPVRAGSHPGAVVAALSVIVPNDGEARAQIPALRTAAQGISRRLAYH